MSFETMTPTQKVNHELWKAARKRLKAPETINPAPPSPARTLAVLTIVPPDPTAEMMDFVTAAVGNVAGLPVNQIIAGAPTAEIRNARNLAIGLCVCRFRLDPQTVANHFEVTKRAVKTSAKVLEPILSRLCISDKTPLEISLPFIWGQWGQEADPPKIGEIINAVCERFGILRQDLISHRRRADYVRARHAAMALAKRLTFRSLLEIGRRMGGRDHTSIIYAAAKFDPIIKAVEQKLPSNALVFDWADAVCTELAITPLAKAKRRKKSV